MASVGRSDGVMKATVEADVIDSRCVLDGWVGKVINGGGRGGSGYVGFMVDGYLAIIIENKVEIEFRKRITIRNVIKRVFSNVADTLVMTLIYAEA